jgi:hypothetical protein
VRKNGSVDIGAVDDIPFAVAHEHDKRRSLSRERGHIGPAELDFRPVPGELPRKAGDIPITGRRTTRQLEAPLRRSGSISPGADPGHCTGAIGRAQRPFAFDRGAGPHPETSLVDIARPPPMGVHLPALLVEVHVRPALPRIEAARDALVAGLGDMA